MQLWHQLRGSGGYEEENQLNLKLWAVTSLSPKSPFASASIEDLGQKTGSQLFHIGNPVVENVTLEEVHPRWVVLINRNERPKRDASAWTRKRGRGRRRTRSSSRQPGPPFRRKRGIDKTLIEELTNYADLVTKVKPEFYRRQRRGRYHAADIAGAAGHNSTEMGCAPDGQQRKIGVSRR
jgi:hypothetical protein